MVQLFPQALGVHLIAFYDLHELAVGLFLTPVTTREVGLLVMGGSPGELSEELVT